MLGRETIYEACEDLCVLTEARRIHSQTKVSVRAVVARTCGGTAGHRQLLAPAGSREDGVGRQCCDTRKQERESPPDECSRPRRIATRSDAQSSHRPVCVISLKQHAILRRSGAGGRKGKRRARRVAGYRSERLGGWVGKLADTLLTPASIVVARMSSSVVPRQAVGGGGRAAQLARALPTVPPNTIRGSGPQQPMGGCQEIADEGEADPSRLPPPDPRCRLGHGEGSRSNPRLSMAVGSREGVSEPRVEAGRGGVLLMSVLIAIVVFTAVLGWLLYSTTKAPAPLTDEQLQTGGYTRARARMEARRQRQEQRSHLHARSNALRAAE